MDHSLQRLLAPDTAHAPPIPGRGWGQLAEGERERKEATVTETLLMRQRWQIRPSGSAPFRMRADGHLFGSVLEAEGFPNSWTVEGLILWALSLGSGEGDSAATDG